MALRRRYDETHDQVLKANLKAQIELLYDPLKTTAREPELRPHRRNTSSTRGESVGKYSTKHNPSAFEYTQAYKDEQAEQRHSYSSPKTKYDPSPSLPPRYSVYEKQKGKGLSQPTKPIPKSFIYIKQIPIIFHNHILKVNDVLGDGHCSFRVVAKAMRMKFGEDDWGKVRVDLQHEIENFSSYYLDILGELDGFSVIRDSFLWNDMTRMPPPHKWMTFPGAGYVIASRYNVALVMMSISTGTTTYLPQHTAPPTKPVVMFMVHVNTNHYAEIIIYQSKNKFKLFPMPEFINGWEEHHSPEADPWRDVFRQNFKYYEALRKQSRSANYFEKTIIPDDE